jgi:glycosyltransferase involved in cell wall biosynthesis
MHADEFVDREMPSVLIFRPTLGQGGADRVTAILIRELRRRGFKISLALLRNGGEYIDEVPAGVTIHWLRANDLSTGLLPLARVLRKENPDVLFSTSSGGNPIAVLAHMLARQQCRLVLSERNVLVHGAPSAKKTVLLWLKRALYRRADLITCVSDGVRRDLVQRVAVPAELTRVVYNPIVDDHLERLAAEPVEHPWFSDPRKPIVMGAGRLVVEKDFGTLIRAFAAVRARIPSHLVLLGEGPLRPELEALAKTLGVAEDVWMPGFDKNPFRYMSKCNCFVLSSRNEGLPGVLIQAMACGAPSIATDCPAGPSEIIQDGHDGLLVQVGDVEAISQRLNRILTDQTLARRIGCAGKLSAGRFRVGQVADVYVQALTGN